MAWVERATGINPAANEWTGVAEIGEPENINPTYGLMDASGSALSRVLDEIYDVSTASLYPNFDTAYSIARNHTGMMSGNAWYHWVAIRGVDDGNIWIANSAPGYQGVYEILTRADFQRLGGFSMVYLT